MPESGDELQSTTQITRMRRSGVLRIVPSLIFAAAFYWANSAAMAYVLAGYAALSLALLSLTFSPGLPGSFWRALLDSRFFAYVRTIGDLLTVAGIVHITGGVDSFSQLAFALPVVVNSLEKSPWRGRLSVLLGMLLPAILELLVLFGLLPKPGIWDDKALSGPAAILLIGGAVGLALGALHGVTHYLYTSIGKARTAAIAERDASMESRAEIQKLNEFARGVNQHEDLDGIVTDISRYAVQSMGMDASFLILVDKDSNEFYSAGGFAPDATEAQSSFMRTARFPVQPETGSIHYTYSRKKTVYMRRIGRIPSDVDEKIVRIFHLKSFVQIPLIVRGKVRGVMTFTPGARRLSRENIGRLEAYVDQIAGAVYTSGLLDSVRRERAVAEELRRESESLNQMLRSIGQLDEIEAIMDVIMKFVEARYGLEFYALYSVSGDGTELNLMSAGFPEWVTDAEAEKIRTTPIRFMEERGVFALAKQRGRLTYFPRVYPDRISGMERYISEIMKVRNFVICPLIVQEETVAFLSLTSYKTRNLSKKAREWLSILSDQIAGVIRSNNLMRTVKREQLRTEDARRKTLALAELSRQAMATGDLQSVIDSVRAFAEEHFSIGNVILMLPEDGFLKPSTYSIRQFAVDQDELKRRLGGYVVPLTSEGGSLSRSFLRNKVFHPPRIKEEWLRDSYYDSLSYEFLKFKSFAHVPLSADGKAIGLLALSSNQHVVLNREDLRLLRAMGDQVAGAVRSAAQLEQVETARAESDRLLANILPASVAEELKREGEVKPLHYENVSVLFTDFVGFTRASQKMMPDELIKELDGYFSQFDEVILRNGMEKLKTIGDAYMCAGGLPTPNGAHPVDACLAALEFRAFMLQMAEVKIALGLDHWRIRIGIHTGPVTAGVIGSKKFAYDIWGDTVNTASRMESSGAPDKINVSRATFDGVRHLFDFEERGLVRAKGKGELEMFFLERIKPELSADDMGLVPNASFEMLRMEVGMAKANTVPPESVHPGENSSGAKDMREGW